MKKDKIKIYFFELILLIFILLALFESNVFSKIILSISLLIYMLVIRKVLKKRNIISIYNKQVILLMLGLALIYLALFYLCGLYFGYYQASIKFSNWAIINYILPLTIIIISSEIIRYIFLSQNSKTKGIFIFLSMVLIDIIIYSQVYDLSKLDEFLTVIGFITFASISSNLLYNYISSRFGYKPIIIYRMITILYIYFIPIIPDIFIFFRSIIRMIYPYIIYLILEYTYSKTNQASSYRDRKKRIIGTTVLVIIITLIVMLISCKFKYGILVIGSGSMTGTINKGDAVVFESYNNNEIKEGQVIIFNKGDLQVVHRVVSIKIVNNIVRYYTKGDANEEIDDDYITNEDIIGISLFKISYIGYPTLWVNEIFK